MLVTPLADRAVVVDTTDCCCCNGSTALCRDAPCTRVARIQCFYSDCPSCPSCPSFSLYQSLFLPPPLPGTLREREGGREWRERERPRQRQHRFFNFLCCLPRFIQRVSQCWHCTARLAPSPSPFHGACCLHAGNESRNKYVVEGGRCMNSQFSAV